jgi:putative endonuclease
MQSAIERKKRIKEWKRKWKLELIEKRNPNWEDLFNNNYLTGFRRPPE